MQKLRRDATGAELSAAAGVVAIAPPGRRGVRRFKLLQLQAYAFVLPSFIGLMIFSLIPIVAVSSVK